MPQIPERLDRKAIRELREAYANPVICRDRYVEPGEARILWRLLDGDGDSMWMVWADDLHW
jgi:hypothetical protein